MTHRKVTSSNVDKVPTQCSPLASCGKHPATLETQTRNLWQSKVTLAFAGCGLFTKTRRWLLKLTTLRQWLPRPAGNWPLFHCVKSYMPKRQQSIITHPFADDVCSAPAQTRASGH